MRLYMRSTTIRAATGFCFTFALWICWSKVQCVWLHSVSTCQVRPYADGPLSARVQVTLGLSSIPLVIETVFKVVAGCFGVGYGSTLDVLGGSCPDARYICCSMLCRWELVVFHVALLCSLLWCSTVWQFRCFWFPTRATRSGYVRTGVSRSKDDVKRIQVIRTYIVEGLCWEFCPDVLFGVRMRYRREYRAVGEQSAVVWV